MDYYIITELKLLRLLSDLILVIIFDNIRYT